MYERLQRLIDVARHHPNSFKVYLFTQEEIGCALFDGKITEEQSSKLYDRLNGIE
ncbi:MAG TPA: hypothetical protein VHP31_12210 [Caproicibacter sp.]|nr:hypothetical protein [Caproicibacter sp.]